MDENIKVEQVLREAGVSSRTIWDLINSGETYARAIPGLIALLPIIQNRRIKEGIVRALGVPEAKGAATAPLIGEMSTHRGDEILCWVIGNTLSLIVTPKDKVFDDLAVLMRDRSLGIGRQMLADALARTKDPRAINVLVEVLPQEDVTGHVIRALGNLKAIEARPQIEIYQGHPKAWIRREVRSALKKIDKAVGTLQTENPSTE